MALLSGHQHWRLTQAEDRDLATAITSWIYSQPKRRQTALVKFFLDVAPTLALLMTIGGILEVRLRQSAYLSQLKKEILMAQQAASGLGPRPAPAPAPASAPSVTAEGGIPIPARPFLDEVGHHPLEELQSEGLVPM